MKFLCVLLIPAVLAAVPSKRVLFDTFLNSQEATRIIDTLVETLATNDNEAKCEQECHILITNQDSVFQHLCPFMCHSAQEALTHLHSPNTDPTATGKRMLLDSFLNTDETSKIIDQLVVTLSSDSSEAACETECHVLIRDSTSVFQHMCPFLCHSAQALIGNLHHTAPATGAKRLVLDSFLNTEETSKIIDQLVVTLSSDSSEAACETECHVLIRDSTSVFQHMCPFLCHSAQALIGNLHHTAPATGAKRLVLDNFLNTEETSKIIDQLVVTLSSDSSEAACETECHVLIRDSTSVFQHMCPFLCHSAQALIGNLHHTAPATGAKRLVIDNFLNTGETSKIIDQLVVTLSSGPSEAACETECHVLIRDSTSVFQHMCPFLCHSAQALIGNLHHSSTPAKRFLVDTLLANPEINVLVTSLVSVLGSDPTEQACEKECVVMMHADSVIHHLCPFVCHSFQQLVSKVHLTSAPSNPSKRFLLDTLLNNPEINVLVTGLVATLGSDPTEQACESQCTTMMHADNVMHHLCPFVCHSFQSLVSNIHLSGAPSKRFLVDSLLNNPEISVLVTGLVATLGSDPTEQACESQCTTMMHADNVLHHLCPFVCHSFQSLVQKVHLTPSVSNPVHKRFLIDSLLNNPEVSVIVNTLVSTLGSDPTEAACESKCVDIVHADNFMHYLCPMVCHSFQSLVQQVHINAPANPVQ